MPDGLRRACSIPAPSDVQELLDTRKLTNMSVQVLLSVSVVSDLRLLFFRVPAASGFAVGTWCFEGLGVSSDLGW